MSLKWKYKQTLESYLTQQNNDLKAVYKGFVDKHAMDLTASSDPLTPPAATVNTNKKLALEAIETSADAKLQQVNRHLNQLKNALQAERLTFKNTADLGHAIDTVKKDYLTALDQSHQERLQGIERLDSNLFTPEQKAEMKTAMQEANQKEKEGADKHFEKTKKDLEEYHNHLGRMESFGYVQARILKPSGEKASPAGIGQDAAIKAFEAFQNDGAKRLYVGGRILDVMSSPDGKVSIKLPPPIMMGNEGKFAADLVNLLHAKGCDTITFEGNVSRKVKLEVWRLANLKEPPMSVSGDFAPTPKEQQALQEEKQKRQQPQQPTPSANTSTSTGPRPGNSSGN